MTRPAPAKQEPPRSVWVVSRNGLPYAMFNRPGAAEVRKHTTLDRVDRYDLHRPKRKPAKRRRKGAQ